MPKEYSRSERVADLIQRSLAELLTREASDPRLAGLTVSEVTLGADLQNATVYVAGIATADTKETLAVLQQAAGFLRKRLARMVHLRSVPKLRFAYDNSFDSAAHLSALIDSCVPPTPPGGGHE